MVAKEEELRKLRVRQCLLEDERSDLHEQLDEEQARSDDLESALDEALIQLDEHKAAADVAQSQIRTQAREVANLKVCPPRCHGRLPLTHPQAELKAMENVTSDSNKILSEKLALTRELSSLRPEVEHLRAQVESNQGLLAEKLSLQRQLNTLQVELENEKRSASRALAKQGKKMEQDDELRGTVEELRSQLAKETKDRLKVEAALARAEKANEKAQSDLEAQQEAAERAQAKFSKASKKEADKASKRDEERDSELEQLRQELAQERNARAKAEKANKQADDHGAELEELKQELEQEKRERQRLAKANKSGAQQADVNLTKELEEEKRERKRQEKEYTKTLTDLQNRNTILDDKLNAFREKLRSTKEKLKEKEAELERVERAQTAPPAKVAREASTKPEKNVRKRMVASVEPDINLGTPGDGFPAKRAKRATSVVAASDTSTFSLTPFLNRKGSVAPGETILEEDEDSDAHEATPTGPPKAARKMNELKAKPLAPSASNKANTKPAPRNNTSVPSLDAVAEDAIELSNSKDSTASIKENATVTIPLKPAAPEGPSKAKTLVPKIKPRKSLMSFASFVDEPVAEKKKKRKLGASNSLGKTLFDDDDGDEALQKPMSGKGLFAARALGKSALGKGRPISGGHNMMSAEGFTFSPLKKDRRAASNLK